MIPSTRTSLFKQQAAAILVMMAGWGWIAGNFAAPFDTFWIGAVTAVGHCIPIGLLLVSGVQFVSTHAAGQPKIPHAQWGQVIITLLAILGIVATMVLSILGASNANPNAVGIKTLDDVLPAIVLTIGALWWLATLLVSARQREHQPEPSAARDSV